MLFVPFVLKNSAQCIITAPNFHYSVRSMDESKEKQENALILYFRNEIFGTEQIVQTYFLLFVEFLRNTIDSRHSLEHFVHSNFYRMSKILFKVK